MSRKSQYTPEQRRSAVELHKTHGPAEASRITGIPKPTIASWARRDGVQTECQPPEVLRNAVATAVLSNAKKRELLTERLLDTSLRLLDEMFAPCIEKKPMAVSGGMNSPGWIEVVQVDFDQPRFSDQVAIAKAVELTAKNANLMAGEATSRVDINDVDAARSALRDRIDEL